MKKVVIVGAGPVGLWTAIQLKLHSKEIDIQMVEQYSQYQRGHVVNIDKGSLKNAHSDPEFQALFPELIGNVSTNKIESTLKNFALKLGIKIQNQKVESCEALEAQYPDAEVIIGADGAHSTVRREMFKDRFESKKSLQYVAELKYEVKGNSRAFSLWSEAYSPLLKANHMVVEHVGKMNDAGNTPVTLRIFMDKSAFKTVKNAKFKNPYRWTEEDKAKLDPKLKQTMEIWLKERETTLKDEVVEGSIKITGLKLGTYTSKEVVLQKNNKTYVLVGDAAFGVPYFRSLNNGLLSGTQLAKNLHETLSKEKQNSSFSLLDLFLKASSPLKTYSEYVSNLARYEDFIASIKGFGINKVRSHLDSVRKALQIEGEGDRSDISIGARLAVAGSAVLAGMYSMYKMANMPKKEEKAREGSVQVHSRSSSPTR